MSMKKLVMVLTVAAILILGGSIGAGAYYFAAQQPSGEKKEAPPAPAAKAPKKEADMLTTLMQERLKLVQEEVEIRQKLFKAGRVDALELIDATQRLFKAELELSPNKEARIAAHQRHVKAMEEFASIAERRLQAGRITAADARLGAYLVIDAKIELEREKARK